MSDFYTNCIVRGDNILYRGVKNGKRTAKKIRYSPKLFVATDKESKLKTLDGQSVSSVSFNSISEANKFISRYEDVDNFEVFGNTGYNYVYISDCFPKEIEFDLEKIVIAIIDIEVLSQEGFPEPKDAKHPIVSICLKIKYLGRESIYVFGCNEFDFDPNKIVYIRCADEQSLIESFLAKWSAYYPDIATGWNSETFDWLYIVNRIQKYYPKLNVNRLSPWGKVYLRDAKGFNNELKIIPEIVGVSILDYMDLYKKFAFKTQESYRLDYICHVELNERKLNYDEYSNLNELYEKDYQKFLDYNVHDVELVDMLEAKLNLVQQAIQLAYDTKSNYTDVYMQVRMWDNIIYNYFRKNELVFPFKKQKNRVDYAGAYVKEPIVGMHNWIISMDVNSMYPNLIAQYNISPDTIVDDRHIIDMNELVHKKIDLDFVKKKDFAIAASGQQFRKDKLGFLSEIILKMYDDRVRYKKLQKKKEKELEQIKAELEKRAA